MLFSDCSSDLCSSDLRCLRWRCGRWPISCCICRNVGAMRPTPSGVRMFEFKKTTHHQKRRMLVRVVVAGVLATLCFMGLVGRLWYLQVIRYDGLSARADQNRIAVVPIPPRRGEILDRNGVVLAKNYRDYTLSVVRAGVERSIEDLLDDLGQLVYLSPSDRRRFMQNLNQSGRSSPVLLRNNLKDTEASWFAAHAFKFPGVELSARWVRARKRVV